MAGILVATVGGGWGIAFDASSFLMAALCLTRLRIPSHPAPAHDSLTDQMRAGWDYFVRRPWIWSITLAFTVLNPIQMGAWRVLGPILAEHTFGAADWGLVLSLQAAGALAASFGGLRRQSTRPLRTTMLSTVVVGLPMVILGFEFPLPYLGIAAVLAGAGSAMAGIAWTTSLQQGIPKDKRSRVMAFDDFGSFVAIPLGLVLVMPTADWLGFTTVEIVGGLMWMIVALLPLASRNVRNMTVGDIQAEAESSDVCLG